MALPTTKLDICNLSLDRIGEKAITQAQLTANTDVRAQTCNRHYEQSRDSLQKSNWWRFARDRINLASVWATGKVYTTDQFVINDSVWYKAAVAHTSSSSNEPPGTSWTTLTSADNVPDSEWDFTWDLPADYLRFRSIFEETDSTSRSRRHALEGDQLLTNLSTVTLLYIKQVTDVIKFDPLYIEVLVLQLSLKLLPARAGVGSAGQALLSEIKDELKPLLAQVKAIDSNETDVGGRSDWNLARHGGLGIMSGEERFL